MKHNAAVVCLTMASLALSGCLGSPQGGPAASGASDKSLSCTEMLQDELIRDASLHGSERYRQLFALYRKNDCPAPEFHDARNSAVHRAAFARLSEEDKTLSCYDLLATRTKVDELLGWYSTAQGQLSPLRYGDRGSVVDGIDPKRLSAMSVRKQGLDSLYRANECDSELSPQEKREAREVFRAPLRYARRNYVRGQSEDDRRRNYGANDGDETALSCRELVEQIRLEEDDRVYRHGAESRAVLGGGSFAGTAAGAILFGSAGVVVGLMLDAQTFRFVKRMTKREGRLLGQLSRKACYFEYAVSQEQQDELSALAGMLPEEDRSLSCGEILRRSQSSMERAMSEFAEDAIRTKAPFGIFWQGRESGALSDRDAGLIVLAEIKDCRARGA